MLESKRRRELLSQVIFAYQNYIPVDIPTIVDAMMEDLLEVPGKEELGAYMQDFWSDHDKYNSDPEFIDCLYLVLQI